jgi:acetylornithine deacetylase/succinyl-diaminopimelate desuccinylase-like protein
MHKSGKFLAFVMMALIAISIAAAGPLDTATAFIDANKQAILSDWIALVDIPAPSKQEQLRVEWVKKEMIASGFQNVSVDGIMNVIGYYPGSSPSAPTVVFAAHTDTVFAMDTPIDPVVKDGRLFAPGSGDCASNVIGMLWAAKAMRAANYTPDINIIFVATAQEEIGLFGMRYFLKEHKGPVDMVVAIDTSLGSISYGALGIQWFKITYNAPAGHTLRSIGVPSATKSMAAAIGRLYAEIPTEAATTTVMNIGVVGGGTVTNAIAAEAWFTVDLRSQNGTLLVSNVEKTKAIVQEVATATGATVKVEQTTDIPGGLLPGAESHKLTLAAVEAGKAIGLTPRLSPAGSCDSNASIALGIPSIAIGVTSSSGGHSTGESSDINSMYTGIKWLLGTIGNLK